MHECMRLHKFCLHANHPVPGHAQAHVADILNILLTRCTLQAFQRQQLWLKMERSQRWCATMDREWSNQASQEMMHHEQSFPALSVDPGIKESW